MGSGGGGGGGNPAMYQNSTPMPGLPIAGKDSTIGNAYEYGKFQSFLPELAKDGGQNPMATGLTPDMFMYKSPSGVVQESNNDAAIKQLRDSLAAIQASQAATQQPQQQTPWVSPFADEPATSRGGGG